MRSLSKRKARNGEGIKSAQPLTKEHLKSLYDHCLTKGDAGKRQFVSIISNIHLKSNELLSDLLYLNLKNTTL